MDEQLLPRQTQIVDTKMIRGLQAFYEVESRDWKDVRGECSRVSEYIARQFGLSYVEGKFVLDMPLTAGGISNEEDHAWCVDGRQMVVDLTAAQFNNGLHKKLPKGLMIIGPEDELFGRYRQSKKTL